VSVQVTNENTGAINDLDAVEELGGVLFDLDGTLIDSEPLWGVSMDRVAGHLGGSLSADVRAATTGQSIPVAVKLLLDDIGSAEGVAETTSLLLSITAEIFAEDLLWQPGAEQLIERVRAAGIKTALVTNSPRQIVDVALGGLLGAHRFDVTICGDEVARGKPDPHPYLHAMELLGLSAAQCLAVEDSPSGTAAAIAAGIPVLVVPSEVPVPEGPGRIFASSLLDSTATELQHIHREFRRYRRAHGG
jgi:HAD superfamily hydrolase (TIGR01509 family)